MLAFLRTYRPLAAMLATFVVVSLVLPLVHEVCAMGAPVATGPAASAGVTCCCPTDPAHADDAAALPTCCTLAAQEPTTSAATLLVPPLQPQVFTLSLSTAVLLGTRNHTAALLSTAAASAPASPPAFLLHAAFLI